MIRKPQLPLTKIFRQAFVLTKNLKQLWLWGFLQFWFNYFFLLLAVSVLQSPQAATETNKRFIEWMDNNQTLSQALSWTVLVLAILFFTLYLVSKSALPYYLQMQSEGKPVSGPQAFLWGNKKRKVAMGVWILTACSLFLATFVVVTPILNAAAQHSAPRLYLLLGLGLMFFVPFILFVDFVNSLATSLTSVFNVGLNDSIRISMDVASKFWMALTVFVSGLIIITLLGYGICIAASYVISFPFVLLSKIPYDIFGQPISNFAIPAGYALSFAVIVFGLSLLTTFQKTSWFFVFSELVRPKKTEQVKGTEEVAPETVS
jgi:hypothetical protein